MTDIQSLMARVEAATGPSEQLDIDIAVAASMVPPEMEKTFTSPRAWRGIYDNRYWLAPEYTASIDAALTLVDRSHGDVVRDALTNLSRRFNLHICFWPKDENYTEWLARFVTAAALRARAAQGEG